MKPTSAFITLNTFLMISLNSSSISTILVRAWAILNMILYWSNYLVGFEDHFSTSVPYFSNPARDLNVITAMDWCKKLNIIVGPKEAFISIITNG